MYTAEDLAILALVAPPTGCAYCAHDGGHTLGIGVSHRTCPRHALLLLPVRPRPARFVVRRVSSGRWVVFDVDLGVVPEQEDGGVIVTYPRRNDAEFVARRFERARYLAELMVV